jgi:hypothetical protein
MAKAVRIGLAGQSTGVEPSLIHPASDNKTSPDQHLRNLSPGRAKWTSAAATRRPRKTFPKTCCTEIRFTLPAPAYLRQARFKKNLTDKPPEPHVIHQPQHDKYRHRDGPARTHQRQWNPGQRHFARHHSHVHQQVA